MPTGIFPTFFCVRKWARSAGLSQSSATITPSEGALVAPMPNKGDFGSSELHETIRGGERVLIRRVRPEDMASYPEFLADVSAEDLRLRFFARIAELSAAETDRLAHLDYRHEMAFIALEEDTGRMLGLVRLKDELDEETAEFAILVRSRLKGHGLGWLLMRRVIDYAKERGLRRVYGDVLVENTIMLQMCAELGFRVVEDVGSDIRRVVLDLENTDGR
jgi:acetyltransferase